jgi:hypothetical protein
MALAGGIPVGANPSVKLPRKLVACRMPARVTWHRVTILAVCLLIGACAAGWIAATTEYCAYHPHEFEICGAHQTATATRLFAGNVEPVALGLMGFVVIALGALLFMLHKTNKSLSETNDKTREAHRRQTASNLRMQATNIEFRHQRR